MVIFTVAFYFKILLGWNPVIPVGIGTVRNFVQLKNSHKKCTLFDKDKDGHQICHVDQQKAF